MIAVGGTRSPFCTDSTGAQAYDSHCNLVLGDVEETVYVVDDEADQDEVKTVSKKSEMLFVRGTCSTVYCLGRPSPLTNNDR